MSQNEEKKKRNRAAKIEFEKRIRSVEEWILQGFSYTDIMTTCMVKYQIEHAQSKRYIQAAYKIIREHSKGELEDKIAWHIELRKKLYRDLKFKDMPGGAKEANKILDSIAKIEGIVVEKVEHSGEMTINWQEEKIYEAEQETNEGS